MGRRLFFSGIAILTTYLDKQVAVHRADLVTNTYAANPEFIQRTAAAAHALVAKGYSVYQAQQGAAAIMNQAVMRQASILAYNDSWLLILKTFIVIAPAVLILRKPKGGGPAVDAH